MSNNTKRANGFKYNDGGRREARFQGTTGDCVVRSIAIAENMEKDYRWLFETLTKEQKKLDKGAGRVTASSKGSKSKCDGICVTIYEPFIRRVFGYFRDRYTEIGVKGGWSGIPKKGLYIVLIEHESGSTHLTVVENDVIIDSWNCRKDGGYKKILRIYRKA